MTNSTNFPKALLDDLAKLATNAAGVAQGAKDEIENLINARVERWLADRNLVTREEFDAVLDMARAARDENDKLRARIEALESRFGSAE